MRRALYAQSGWTEKLAAAQAATHRQLSAQQLVSFMDMSRSFEIKIKMISEMKELDDSGTTMMRYA